MLPVNQSKTFPNNQIPFSVLDYYEILKTFCMMNKSQNRMYRAMNKHVFSLVINKGVGQLRVRAG